MAEKNYYDILGVDKKASEADIKKAYRKLVRQYHPDINDSPDADAKMGEINNAYETLKDAEKRAQYDLMLDNPYMGQGFGGMGGGMGGGQGFNANMSQADLDEILRQFGGGAGGRQSQSTGGFRFDDIFSTFGGGAGGFSDGFGGRQSQRSTKGEDQHAELSIDLKATYKGDTRKISLNLPVQTATGLDYQTKTIEVKIPRGIAEGQQIRLAKQGNPSPYGGDNGDLYLKIKFNHPDNIRVEGKDVFQTVDVAPWEAAMGGQITGVCQHSCHPYLNQATETSLALTRLDRRTGLRAVGSTGEQFLTALPFQRAGFTCFAITSTDSRLARISPSLSV